MSQATPISFEDAPFTSFHKKITAGTFMGLISDGYTLGIVGIALTYAAEPLALDSFWMGLIGSMAMFGIFFGSLITGIITDRIGRKKLYPLFMFLTVLVSVWMFFLSDPLLITIARFILGMLIGADYAVGISYLSEWAPTKKRTGIMAWLLTFWTIGYTLSYIAGFFMDGLVASFGDGGWRLVLCSSAVPALIAMIIRLGAPESALWLIAKEREKEALDIIHKYLGAGYGLPDTPQERAASSSWFALFAPKQWRKTIVSGVFFFAQVVPFFSISIFLPIVLKNLNIEDPDASGVLYNVFTMVGVLVGMWLYSVMTRRGFLLWTFYLSAALLTVIILWTSVPPIMALVLVIVLALILAISIVPEFSYPAELFPTELRGSGVGLTIAISRFGSGGGTFLLPIISEQFGIQAALWVCVGTLLFGGIICQMWAPETSGKGKAKA